MSLEPCSKLTATDGRGAKVKRQWVPDNCSCDENAPPTEPSCSGLWYEQITTLGQAETRRARIVSNCADNAAEVGRPGASVSAAILNCILWGTGSQWRTSRRTGAKNRCDVLLFTKNIYLCAHIYQVIDHHPNRCSFITAVSITWNVKHRNCKANKTDGDHSLTVHVFSQRMHRHISSTVQWSLHRSHNKTSVIHLLGAKLLYYPH